jgi:hypothetical protein
LKSTTRDIISRDTLKRLTTDLARHLLGIDGEAIELLKTQKQRIEDRRAGLVARMRGSACEECLLHVEIANNNSSDMRLRMLRYYTDIRFAGHPAGIREFLVYIGSGGLTMNAGIEEQELLDYRFGLVDMAQRRLCGATDAGQSGCPGAGRTMRLWGAQSRRCGCLHRTPLEGAVGCKRATFS